MSDTSQVITPEWYTSKTVWINIITKGVVVASYFGFRGQLSQDDITQLASVGSTVSVLVLLLVSSYCHMRSRKATAVTIPIPVTVPSQETTVVSLNPIPEQGISK